MRTKCNKLLELHAKMRDKGIYLGTSDDMAHHTFCAYQIEDEIHILYDNGHNTHKKIQTIIENKDAYLYTPYVMFIDKCGYNNSTKKGEV